MARWQSIKLLDKSEEEQAERAVIRDKERFSNQPTLVFGTGGALDPGRITGNSEVMIQEFKTDSWRARSPIKGDVK